MNNGISVSGDGKGVAINGIRCGVVSDVACDIAKQMLQGKETLTIEHPEPVLSDTELVIALAAARKLKLWRTMRMSMQSSRKKFVQFIVDEAQRAKPDEGDPEDAAPVQSEPKTDAEV